ncbi:NADH:quinone oxidoreductase [Celeribacter sp.]|uniref:NADH:quinone oxidoreductase n=1 Tax=Celeribacter sp. TaxID=1890673 RepID=UPI003A8E3DEA
MSETNAGKMPKIWLVAAICGVLAFLALLFIASYSTGASLIVGILVAVLVAILLWIGWYEEDSEASNASAPSVASTAAVASSEPAVTPEPAKTAATDGAQTPVSQMAADTDVVVAEAAVADTAEPEAPVATKAPAKKALAKTAAAKKPAAKATKAKTDKAADAKTAPAKPAAKTAPKRAPVAKDGTPDNLLTAARADGADDLKMIKGVGPKLEATLNELGIYHYDQIAALRKKEREWLDDRLKFKGRIDRDDWVGQAKKLARGEATEFSKRAKY